MNLNQITGPVGLALRVVSMALAAAAVLKMSGFVSIRFSVMELCAAAIACALAK